MVGTAVLKAALTNDKTDQSKTTTHQGRHYKKVFRLVKKYCTHQGTIPSISENVPESVNVVAVANATVRATPT